MQKVTDLIPAAPKPIFILNTHPRSRGDEGHRSGEGGLHLPSIPADYSGSWRRNKPGNAVLGGHASVRPCNLRPVLPGAAHALSWPEACWNGISSEGSLASVLNPEPAPNEGDPHRASHRGQASQEADSPAWVSSRPPMTLQGPACKARCELPTPGEGGESPDPREKERGMKREPGRRALLLQSARGSDPKPPPRSSNFTNNPSTCSLHLFCFRSPRILPFSSSSFSSSLD